MSGNHELNNLAAPIPQAQPEPEVHEPTPSATSPQHREAEANVQQGIQGETSQDGEQKFSVIIWLAGLRKKASFWIFNGLILAFTCFQLWPAITTQHDTRTTLSLAQWTAKKDFLEWCNSQACSLYVPFPPHTKQCSGRGEVDRGMYLCSKAGTVCAACVE